jgi:hypothetical protein
LRFLGPAAKGFQLLAFFDGEDKRQGWSSGAHAQGWAKRVLKADAIISPMNTA